LSVHPFSNIIFFQRRIKKTQPHLDLRSLLIVEQTGETVLHRVASDIKDPAKLSLLLERLNELTLDLEARTLPEFGSCTALMMARDPMAVKILCIAGADFSVTSPDGKGLFEIYTEQSLILAKLLLEEPYPRLFRAFIDLASQIAP
jgi:hypothetical protein